MTAADDQAASTPAPARPVPFPADPATPAAPGTTSWAVAPSPALASAALAPSPFATAALATDNPFAVPHDAPSLVPTGPGASRSVLGPTVGAATPSSGPASTPSAVGSGFAASTTAPHTGPSLAEVPRTEVVPSPRSGESPVGRRLPDARLAGTTVATQPVPTSSGRPDAALAAVGAALVPGSPTTAAGPTLPVPAGAPGGSSTAVPASGRQLPPGSAPTATEAPSRRPRRRLLLGGAATVAALALGAVVVVSGLLQPAPTPETTTVPAGASAPADAPVTAQDGGDTTVDAAAPAEAGAGALVDEPLTRDPFAGGTGAVADVPAGEAAVPDGTLLGTSRVTGAIDATGTTGAAAAGPAGASSVVPAGLQVTWTEVRDGGWYVFTVVDGTEGTTVAATAGSALGLEPPASGVVFTGPSTVVDGAGGVVDSVAVQTTTGVLQLVLGQSVTVS